MELFLFILIIGLYFYFKNKGSSKESYNIVFDDDFDEYESRWDSTYKEPKHYLLESEYPLFVEFKHNSAAIPF